MFRRLTPFVALFLVYLMIPGSLEATENLVHFLQNGHTAHGVDDEEHSSTDPEHGCSGPNHICVCHSATSMIRTVPVTGVLPPPIATIERADAGTLLTAGYPTSVFRPPIV